MEKRHYAIDINGQDLYVTVVFIKGQKEDKDYLGAPITPSISDNISIIDIEPMDNNKFDLYNLLFDLDGEKIMDYIEDKVWDKIYANGEK